MMWFPDIKALSFLVHVGFTISSTVKKMQTLVWPRGELAGLENGTVWNIWKIVLSGN